MARMVRRWWGLFTGALSFAYLTFVLNSIQMFSVLIYPFSPRLCRRLNRWCARSIWGLWVLMGERQNGIDVRVVGDDVPKRENALLLPNHQTMADVLALLSFSWRCGRLGDLKWFVKDIVKYVPGPGWGMKFLDCVFVKRDWMRDERGIRRLFEKYRKHDIPIFLVSFLEGTRLTPEKHADCKAFAEERGLFVPAHTLVPRTKGFVATMHGLSDHLDAVYDITIGYPERTPTLMDCFRMDPFPIEIHVRRFPIAAFDVTDADALTAWVFERYREKDALLTKFRETGHFPGSVWPDEIRLKDWFADESRHTPRS